MIITIINLRCFREILSKRNLWIIQLEHFQITDKKLSKCQTRKLRCKQTFTIYYHHLFASKLTSDCVIYMCTRRVIK